MKSLQFEIWQECNSRCKYCYLGKDNRCTPKEVKLQSLKDIYEKICDNSIYEEYDNLSYIGGEFFQGQLSDPEVKELFMKIMSKTAELLRIGTIKSVWLCCTLTIGDQADLYEVLKLFEGITWEANSSDGLWLITSHDTIGRFHTEQMLDNWKYHMHHIHELYPHVKFNTTMILTNDLIKKFLNNEFSFTDYMNTYHSSLFFKQPAPGYFSVLANNDLEKSKKMMQEYLPDFFPERSIFLKFLKKLYFTNPELFDKLFNIKYRADDLYRNFNDLDNHMVHNHRYKDSKMETNMICDMAVNKCGHLMQYAAYYDCDKCMICDRDDVYKILSELE